MFDQYTRFIRLVIFMIVAFLRSLMDIPNGWYIGFVGLNTWVIVEDRLVLFLSYFVYGYSYRITLGCEQYHRLIYPSAQST